MRSAGAATLAVLLTACHRHDLGTGNRTVEREYARSAERIWDAAAQGVREEGLKILSLRRDGLGGTLTARRAGGDVVRLVVVPLTDARCRLSIRVGPDDPGWARALHQRVAARAGLT